jgi:hypothetical protein
MRLPDFLIIGAAKSGTTTLYKYLCRHPQFYCPGDLPNFSDTKEPNFFGMDEHYAKGIDHYSSLFAGAQEHQICGEASTDYTKWSKFPNAAPRIAKNIPQVKLIYQMRNPVDRAYSYYVHLNRDSKIEETFEEHIARTNVCLDGSSYMMQIEQYLKFFPKESFLFLLMEDLIDKPVDTMHQVFDFLDIDPDVDITQESEITANQANKRFEDTIREKITAPLRANPVLATVASMVPQSSRDWAYNLLQKTSYGKDVKNEYLPPPMLPETRKMLLEKFHSPNQKLANFIGRDLSHWNV